MPNSGTSGLAIYDDAFMFNGSPERYEWKLVGKKEMIVPYSNYSFLFEKKVEDMLGPKFLDPESIRWEKHRVWVVESTLKEGQRHLYKKRRWYIDEDSWNPVMSENFDGRGNLWRVQYTYPAFLYDRKTGYNSSYGAYDLLQNIYNLNAKPIPGGFANGVKQGDKYFTPKGLARGGVR